MKIDVKYQTLLRAILDTGKWYNDPNSNSKRLQIPFYTDFTHEFKDGFPLISLREINYKNIVGELIWFVNGDNHIKYLIDNGINIWNKDAYVWHTKTELYPLSEKDFFERGGGDVGQNYSIQWRAFNGFDQLKYIVDEMKVNPHSTRLMLSAWNPPQLNKTAVPPCHTGFQIVCEELRSGHYGFHLMFDMRSCDAFLGLPYNMASYATLAKTIQAETGYIALSIRSNLRNVHLYENQIQAAKELLKREPLDNPFFTGCSDSIWDMKISDYRLSGYYPHPRINVKMIPRI